MFQKNLRLTANYRNQYIQFHSFSAYSFAVDVNILRNKLNGDFIGLGLGVFQETEGEADFQNTKANISFAFNKLIANKNVKHHLSLGFAVSYFLRQANLKNLVYGNFYEKNENTDPIDFSSYQQKLFMDLSLGLNYVVNLSDNNFVGIGFSMANILEQTKDFKIYQDAIVYRKYSFHINSEIEINKKIKAIPLIFMQFQGPHAELNFGAYFKYLFNERKNTALYLGVQYRMSAYQNSLLGSDAIIPGIRVEVASFDLGFSYDFTLSSLAKSKLFVGGPELNLVYTFAFKNNRNMMKCPKF